MGGKDSLGVDQRGHLLYVKLGDAEGPLDFEGGHIPVEIGFLS